MTQFEWLLLGHLIGDFLLQTSWMARNKASQWMPLLVHVTIYTMVVTLLGMGSGGLSVAAIAVIFFGHVILDRKTFVLFWVSRVQRVKGNEPAWLSIMTDQIFHIILLAVAIAIS